MGHWGYGPFDNDTAGDWVGCVSDSIKTEIEKVILLKKFHRGYDLQQKRDITVAAICLLDNLSGFPHFDLYCSGNKELYKRSELYLKSIKSNSDGWIEPRQRNKSMKILLRSIQKKIRRGKDAYSRRKAVR